MNIDDFSKEIDKLLTANEIKMMVTFPEGGMEPIIKTNIPEFDSAAIHFLFDTTYGEKSIQGIA